MDHGLVLPEQVAGRDEQHMLSTAVRSSVCCLQCQNAAEGHLLLSALQESRILTAWCKWAHLLPGPGPAQMEVGAEALGFGCSSSSSAAAVAVAKVSSQQRQPALMHSILPTCMEDTSAAVSGHMLQLGLAQAPTAVLKPQTHLLASVPQKWEYIKTLMLLVPCMHACAAPIKIIDDMFWHRVCHLHAASTKCTLKYAHILACFLCRLQAPGPCGVRHCASMLWTTPTRPSSR